MDAAVHCCGGVPLVCAEVASRSLCERLVTRAAVDGASLTVAAAALVAEAATAGAGAPLPVLLDDATTTATPEPKVDWGMTVWPWVLLPIFYRLAWLAACIILRPLYRTLLNKSSCCNRLVKEYVGRLTSPNPVRPYPLVSLGVVQLFASLCSVILFVLTATSIAEKEYTVTMTQEWYIRCFECTLGAFFVFHQFTLYMKNEFIVNDRCFHALTLIDMLTVPQLLTGARCGNLGLGYLRTYRALVTYERLEVLNTIGVIHFFRKATPMTREIIMAALKFVSLIVLFAGTILILEVLGDPPWVKEHTFNTAMGEISFFTLFYWVIETISTVGYGDYAPKTIPSKFVTMFCMISGVLFFAVETSKFIEIQGLQQNGSGAFIKTKKDHIVVLGTAVEHLDTGLLTAFFAELYHPEYRSKWPNCCVLLGSVENVKKMHSFISMKVDGEARNLLTVLHGSSVATEDLQRCQCATATLVYIITDTHSAGQLSPVEEDQRNMIRAVSITRNFPMAPLRLMQLRTESRTEAIEAGLNPQRCYAADEMKVLLLWQSSRIIGWSTLICNLLVTLDKSEIESIKGSGKQGVVGPQMAIADAEAASSREPGWRFSYGEGLRYCIFGFLPNKLIFRKSGFRKFVELAYIRTGTLIVGAQIRGVIYLAPFHLAADITEDTVLFCLAKSELDLEPIMAKGKDWRVSFGKSRFEKFKEDDYNSFKKTMQREGKKLKARRTVAYNDHGRDSLSEPLLGDLQATQDPRLPPPVAAKASHDDSVASLAKKPVSPNSSLLNLEELEHKPQWNEDERASQETLNACEKCAARIRERDSDFITFIDISKTWDRAAAFIRQYRSTWMVGARRIIILTATFPSKALAQELRLGEDASVGCVFGQQTRLANLVRAGVRECSIVVCPAIDDVENKEGGGEALADERQMEDAEALVIYQTLDYIGVTMTAMMLFEFRYLTTAKLLPPRLVASSGPNVAGPGAAAALKDAQGEKKIGSSFLASLNAKGPKKTRFQSMLCNMPRYVSGRIFCADCLGSLLGRAFHAPGVMEVFEILTSAKGAENEYCVFQAAPKKHMVGKDFQSCFLEFMGDTESPALALGLYRWLEAADEAQEEDPPAAYVMMGPALDTVIRPSDLFYVLAQKQWASRAAEEGYLR